MPDNINQKKYGFELTNLTKEQLSEANKTIFGKKLKVKVKRLTTIQIEDSPIAIRHMAGANKTIFGKKLKVKVKRVVKVKIEDLLVS